MLNASNVHTVINTVTISSNAPTGVAYMHPKELNQLREITHERLDGCLWQSGEEHPFFKGAE